MRMRVVRARAPYEQIRGRAAASAAPDPALSRDVAGIIEQVRTGGDAALLELVRRFDGFEASEPDALLVPAERLPEALEEIPADLRRALERATANIRRFHERQMERGFLDTFPDGSVLGQRVLPLARIGTYVPGGRAAYPSSVLMTAIPALVAGVDEVVMATPARGGEILPSVLAAAALAGVGRIYRMGGAHAIAALAHGTPTVPRVDKVVGPGNRWVTEAKRQVFGRVAIDMI